MLGPGAGARRFPLTGIFVLRSRKGVESAGAIVATSSVTGAAEARLRRSSKVANTTVQSRVCILTMEFFWCKILCRERRNCKHTRKIIIIEFNIYIAHFPWEMLKCALQLRINYKDV